MTFQEIVDCCKKSESQTDRAIFRIELLQNAGGRISPIDLLLEFDSYDWVKEIPTIQPMPDEVWRGRWKLIGIKCVVLASMYKRLHHSKYFNLNCGSYSDPKKTCSVAAADKTDLPLFIGGEEGLTPAGRELLKGSE